MFDNSNLSYWLLWLFNQGWFWIVFILGLTVLACWPIIVDKVDAKAFRINNFRIKYIERKMFTGR
jgi:hypothetical protein